MEKIPLTERKYIATFTFVTSLFMLWGIAISMGDVLNRHFQKVLGVTLGESGLVQFSIFGAYAVMGIPAGIFMNRFGYKNGVIFGLCLYAIGAFLFIPAAGAESFGFFRIALFVLACGLATLETVAHPFSAALGDERKSEQRINFSQTFNAIGTIIGPLLGGFFILSEVNTGDTQTDLMSVKLLYAVIGAVVLAIAAAFWFIKVPPLHERVSITGKDRSYRELFQYRHFRWAVVAQFFNVAAQGGTWAFFINYAVRYMPGMTDERAAYYFGLSMVMMLAGRIIGTYLMNFISANKLLAIYTSGSIVFCLLIWQTWGWVSFVSLIGLQFTFSIMFPTIFGLGLKNLHDLKEKASSFIVMGVVGGALFPPLMGQVADKFDVATAYLMPIICYVVILVFALRFSKPTQE
ncbi:MAG: L-fucose:H+ symporter permease [Cyclobacteriaceae bacterium]|jgi:FHS family L-fucose permease-like MFS transporter|nr:L-fucose:H+ symporter permease [Cyclobacteriaceae bacterium]MDH4296054.1 L-fucose:H+ symporter permease [Cyclobacteriaceae bacterium]MDH5248324.1 L-fucose:H+ symporter permease [Cyclobacteriaceae bacterium]